MKTYEKDPMPGQTGWAMPAECALHERCWMAWPTRARWGRRYAEACKTHAGIARAIAQVEPVVMAARASQATEAASVCGPAVTVLPMPVDDLWMRDTGPTFLTNRQGELAGTTWRFNAWGGKHSSYQSDAALAGRILDHLGLPRYDAPLVNEGGAFSVDGEGTVLTTESALLNANRNPDLNRSEIEDLLLGYTGGRKLVWLPGSAMEEVTDGHVDGIAVFAQPGVVIAEICTDPDDLEREILAENLRAVRLAKDAKGRELEVLTIERPPWDSRWPEDFAASYVNFYLANGAVIMPEFGNARADSAAAEVIASAFPGRKIVRLNIDGIAVKGGGIHCVTQQQPSAFLSQ